MKRNRSVRTLPLENLNLLQYPLPDSSYFGEEVTPKPEISSDDSDVILTSVRDVDDKSSSSSLSWGEIYKSEASKQISDELERMDRVLQGLEPIPFHYDKEEYQEWMELFPNLCISGTSCDKLKKSVISDSFDIDSYLKVSPLGGARLHRRQSLISSQMSSSKWLKDDEFSNLPFVNHTERRKLVPKGILKNNLVLPPIDAHQYRSISATPRRQTQSSTSYHRKLK